MNLKSFCIAKVTVIRTNQQLTEWEKIFTTYIFKGGLRSKIYSIYRIKKIKQKTKTIPLCSKVKRTVKLHLDMQKRPCKFLGLFV